MKRLELLDYGRFAAALAVLAYHYFFNGIHNGKLSSLTHISGIVDILKYGYLGVEFFFMISGYVIFFSARGKTAGQFAVSRAARLYPAFWTAVIFTSILAQFWGGDQMSVSPVQAAVNMTMIPGIFGQSFVDGVYWTLQYELNFYALVLTMLVFGLQSKLEHFFVLWPLAMLLASLLGRSYLPFAGGYYSYFAAGALFAILKNRRSALIIVSLLASLYICIQYSTDSANMLAATKGTTYSATLIGTIIIVQFLVFLTLISPYGSSMSLPGSKLAGGLTYPLYLIHAHVGYMILSKFATDDNRALAYSTTIIMVLIMAYLIHRYVEMRLSKTWHSLFSVIIGSPIDVFSKSLQLHIHRLTRIIWTRLSPRSAVDVEQASSGRLQPK